MVGGYFLPSNLFSKGGDPRNLPSCRTLTSFSKRGLQPPSRWSAPWLCYPDGRRPGFAVSEFAFLPHSPLLRGEASSLHPDGRRLGVRYPDVCRHWLCHLDGWRLANPQSCRPVFQSLPSRYLTTPAPAILAFAIWQTRRPSARCPGACRLDTSPPQRPLPVNPHKYRLSQPPSDAVRARRREEAL